MQRQADEHSEEYYKMKYYKYRAKYEKLLEQQGGINFSNLANKVTKTVGMDAESKAKREQMKEDSVAVLFRRIVNLINQIYDKDNINNYKRHRLFGQLEKPCTFQTLIDIINTLQEKSDMVRQEKNDIIRAINNTCKTITGGLKAECKMTIADVQQGGIYNSYDSDSLETIDDLTLTDF